MRNRNSGRVLILAAALILSLPVPALSMWGACKTCSSDTYGQAICLLAGGIGPEGGTHCQAWHECWDGNCYEICQTWEACSWT